MKLKSIKIGSVQTENNLFLAPLAGYTDYAFRAICIQFGAGLTFTEMVSAKGLIYDNENTKNLLITSDAEKVKAVQLFGSEPDVMRAACESEALKKFDIIDINMGCPVPKLFKSGEGSALLNNPQLAEKIVSECAKSGKNITVKMRIGINSAIDCGDFAKRLEGSGCRLITVHGRLRNAYYSGEVDCGAISEVKNAVSIPVIANGGIFTPQDADGLIEKTGTDGVMVARGAMYCPWLFSEISGKTCVIDKKEIICRQIDELLKNYSDRFVTLNMRKQIACYLKGERNGKQVKTALMTASDTAQLKALVNQFF